MQKELWVCWVKPLCLLSENIRYLSFLRPSDEEKLVQSISEEDFVSGRSIAQEVKDDALKLYTEVVAHIGAEKIKNNSSLRELLKASNGNSLWWYHPISFKDCEADPTFNRIIQILVIDRVASEVSIGKIVLCGADEAIVRVLKSKYRIACRDKKQKSTLYKHIKPFGSRLKQFIKHVYHWYLIRKDISEISFIPDVLLEGFWDWSVRSSTKKGDIDDRYFKSLPNILEKQGIKTAWLLWFNPHSEPGLEHRSSRGVLNGAYLYNKLIFAQKYIKLVDIVKEFFDFRPIIKYLSCERELRFRNIFYNNSLNLFPLFRDELLYHFISSAIPHHVLVEKACCNVFMKYKPKIAFTFLEFFPHSRAFYAGAKQGRSETMLATMQHASYSREKTFSRLEPEIEFYGKPDDCPIPKPDYLFAMGELGKKIFQECGFPSQNIFLTGSARYDHIRAELIVKPQRVTSKIINLLMVTTLDRELEMDMIEAVSIATSTLPDVNLFLRNHPFARMDGYAPFQPMKERITITNGTLDEDIQNADLIIFSYTTVAEEAFIRGVPVWQWCTAGYNGSAFRDIKVIPKFYSVLDLRDSLKKFICNPVPFLPEESTKKDVLKKCFYKGDSKSAERIANSLIGIIKFGQKTPSFQARG